MTTTARPVLHVDQLEAVRTAAVNLARDLDGSHDQGTFERL